MFLENEMVRLTESFLVEDKDLFIPCGRQGPIYPTLSAIWLLMTWIVPCSTTSFCHNICWIIANWTNTNTFQWNFNQNTNIFFQENDFWNNIGRFCFDVLHTASLLSESRYRGPKPASKQFRAVDRYRRDNTANSNRLSIFQPIPNRVCSTHWGRVTHICVGKLTTIGSDNGLSPGRRQAIIWTIAGILLIGPLGTNFSKILIGIQTFSFKKMHLKMSSAKWRPFVSALMC